MKIVLIANYPLDHQQSMQRYVQMLHDGLLSRNINVEIWYPKVLFAKYYKATSNGIGKWLGYVDKYIVYPFVLKQKLKTANTQNHHFHICDHSNAVYLNCFPANAISITCHDVLAIRGALGFKDAYCSATFMGIKLQQWILGNLLKFPKIISVSEFTHRQLLELNNGKYRINSKVVHNAFNAPFSRMENEQIIGTLADAGINITRPYLFHIGSNLRRKNKRVLIEALNCLKDSWNGNLILAGPSLDEELQALIQHYNLSNRVINTVHPDHSLLNALYNGAFAFVFPSLSEGFGWPVIEAQACQTPVITSNFEPMIEVSGNAAMYCDPLNAEEIACAVLKLTAPGIRENLIEKGLINTQRFEPGKMINKTLSYITE